MNVRSGLSDVLIEKLVKAFCRTTEDILNDIDSEYNLSTGNYKNVGAWDIRFSRIKQVAIQNDLTVLTKKRGIWTFICVLNPETGVIYLFTKEKNLDFVIKNLGKQNIHYFHAFVSLNSKAVDLENHQMSLFSILTEEYEVKRLREIQKILGEDYPLVERVVFVVAREENKKIVNVEAKLFNKYFEILDLEDWSSYIPEDEYSDLFIPDNEIIERQLLEDSNSIIPKIKPGLKKQKEFSASKILAIEKIREKDKGKHKRY